ncbi:MAG: hypothetical protein WB815_14020 [Nitrososphaeraceae archaeon]
MVNYLIEQRLKNPIRSFLLLDIFLANTVYISSYSGAEIVDVVAKCKGNVIKFVPLGGYPEGSEQVMAALTYSGTLG